MQAARERLIVALDVPNAPEALRITATIGDSAQVYKVGKQLFTAEGPQVVRDLVASGRDVFLDLKYHDIPNTVAGAVRQAAQLGVRMLTVHASGGLTMLKAAVEAAAEVWPGSSTQDRGSETRATRLPPTRGNASLRVPRCRH